MTQTHRFEMFGDIAIFRVHGDVPFAAAMQSVTTAITSAQQQRIGKLMIVTLELSTMKPPSIATRHLLAREWAIAAGASMRVAIVAKVEMIDPQKLGVIVARNFGATANAFTTEQDAIAWLDGSD
jgi:hypothetical protein